MEYNGHHQASKISVFELEKKPWRLIQCSLLFYRWEIVISRERKWLVQRHPRLVRWHSQNQNLGLCHCIMFLSHHMAHGWNLLQKYRCSFLFQSFQLLSQSRTVLQLKGVSPTFLSFHGLLANSHSVIFVVGDSVQHRAKNSSLIFPPTFQVELEVLAV